MEWQPIETAPKDGTVLLLGEFRDGEARAFVGRFGLKTGAHLIASWLSIPGYFQRIPTHWMPLPDPPCHSPVWHDAREAKERGGRQDVTD